MNNICANRCLIVFKKKRGKFKLSEWGLCSKSNLGELLQQAWISTNWFGSHELAKKIKRVQKCSRNITSRNITSRNICNLLPYWYSSLFHTSLSLHTPPFPPLTQWPPTHCTGNMQMVLGWGSGGGAFGGIHSYMCPPPLSLPSFWKLGYYATKAGIGSDRVGWKRCKMS